MTRLPRGIGAALLAALLFGLSTPLAKLLLAGVTPVLLAGLLYLGSGIGLTALRSVRRRSAHGPPLAAADIPWLAGAVLSGGVAGPVLLMIGLRATSSSTAALLLNLEGSSRRFSPGSCSRRTSTAASRSAWASLWPAGSCSRGSGARVWRCPRVRWR